MSSVHLRLRRKLYPGQLFDVREGGERRVMEVP